MKYLLRFLIVVFFILRLNTVLSQTEDSGTSFIFAKKLYDDKMYDLAAEQFHQFAEKDPDNPKAAEALYLAGLSYFNIKEFQKAKKAFTYLILRFPEAKNLDEAQYKIAECFQMLGDLPAAANSYRQVKVFYPKSTLAEPALFISAKMFFDAKEYEKTEEVLYEFFEAYPLSKQYLEAQLIFLDSFIQRKNFDRALIEIEKILSITESGTVNATALLKKANIQYSANRLEQAIDDYQRLIDKYAKQQSVKSTGLNNILDEAYYNLSDIYRKKGMFEKSNEYLYKISSYQNNSKVLFLIADNNFRNKKYAEAIALYKKVILNPDSAYIVQTYYYLGDSYNGLNDFVNAINAYIEALRFCKVVGDSVHLEVCRQSYFKISDCYLELNQPNLAIAYLKKYREERANRNQNIDAVDYRIAYWYETKTDDLERAIRAYYDFIDKYPQSKFIDEAQLGLAQSYEKKEDWYQALLEYNNFLNYYPASEHYFKARNRLDYITKYYPTSSNPLQDVGKILQQLTSEKENAITLHQLSLIYFKELKDYHLSINLWKKCYYAEGLENLPRDELLYYQGRAYQLLGEKEYNLGKQSAYLDSASYNYSQLLETFSESRWIDQAAYHQIELKRITLNKDDPTYFQQLKDALTTFSYKYLKSPILDEVNYELGVLLMEHGIKSRVDSLDIYNNFENIIVNFPKSPLKPDAAYFQALLFYKMNDLFKAEEKLNLFTKDYPNSHYACSAYFLLAKLAESKENYAKSIDFLQQIITKYYYSDYADSARLKIGSIYTKQKKFSEAVLHFLSIYENYNSLDEVNFRLNEENNKTIYQEVLLNLAKNFIEINDSIKAKVYLQTYLELFPIGIYTDQVLFLLGDLFGTSKKEDQTLAIDYLQRLEHDFTDSNFIPSTLIKLGDLFFKSENYGAANEDYTKALKYQLTNSDYSHASAQIVIGLYKLGKIQEGDEKYKIFERQFSEEKSKLAEMSLEKGDYYLQGKNFDQAEKIFKSIRSDFKKSPEGLRAEFSLGKLYFILNKDKEALEILTDLIEKNPEANIVPEVFITLGNFYYLQAKQIENAMLAYKTAIERPGIDENNLKVGMNNLIKCYSDLQLWDKAISLTRVYLDKYPLAEDVFEKKIQIGYFYFQLHEYDYAIQQFKKLKPEADVDNEPRIQYWIGESYFAKGQFEQAISEYLKIAYLSRPAKLLSQYRVTAQYQAAMAYIKLGKLENAKQLFQRIIMDQGAESVFGKPAKQKLEELENMIPGQKQETL